MLYTKLLFKCTRNPLLMTKRWKVRMLPTKHGDDEIQPKATSNSVINLLSFLHKKKFTLAELKNWHKWKVIQDMREDQSYIPERHQILGPDLATTHFLTARGGKVKFTGNDKWVTYDDIKNSRIPSFYVTGFFVEEIDASGMELCYEGLYNLCNLVRLKKLNLSNCPFIDDWCLNRSYLFANTLEYLDISGCHLITERGICSLHPLKKLKTLVINDTPNIQNKELVCLLLQDIIPDCKIIGVNFNDPVLLKRLDNFIH